MINATRQEDVTVIQLGSSYQSLDEDALEELGGLLLSKATTAEPPLIVLDLSNTSFVGSVFIDLLVRAWKRLRERGGTMALCGVRPFCAEVLHVSRLDTLWESFATQDEAAAAVRDAATGDW